MKRGFIIAFIFWVSLSTLAGTKWNEWKNLDLNDLDVELSKVQLRNRASCAIDSKKPTRSMFIFLNNTIAAKAAYRLANRTGQDRATITKELIRDFRNKTTRLTQEIHEKLLSGQLPLLPHLDSENNIPVKYRTMLKECYGKLQCPQLNYYIENIWTSSHRLKHRLYDSFEDSNYFNSKYIKDSNTYKCLKVKKFGPLQANLFGQKPSIQDLNRIAKQLSDIGETVDECRMDGIDTLENLQVAGYQFDIKNIKERYWDKKVGFDYWNSMKLYFAWAMKNLKVENTKYENIIRNSNTQDYILFSPNGCRSDIMPTCNNKRLAENSFREFSRRNFEKEALELDILSPISEGVQNDLLKDPFANVNKDILDLGSYDDADAWIQHIFKNQTQTKNYVKNKLIDALTFYTLVRKRLDPKEVRDQLDFYFRNLDGNIIKNDLYYLCAEASVISDDIFSFTKKHIEGLKGTELIDNLDILFTDSPYNKIIDYYKELMDETRSYCKGLKQKEIWDESFEIEYEGFHQWYIDKTRADQSFETFPDKHYESDALSQDFIIYKNGDIICRSISHCLRKSIISIIETSRATYYGDLFWKSKFSQPSSDLFNPYAERVACKVYDPYFKTKQVMTRFVSDIGQGLMSWFTPGVLYTRVSLTPGYVTSFNKMIEDGQIEFNKEYEKSKVNVELITEFGPLIGVPCAVSITGSNKSPTNLYHFRGISVGACVDRQGGDIIANSGSDISDKQTDGVAACAACRINFEGISNTLTYFNSKLGPFFYIARALYSLYQGLTDFDNIPRRWELDLNKLKTTYQRYGEIPKSCRSTLLNGRNCLKDKEELAAVELIQRNELTILASKKIINGYKFKVQECNNELTVMIDKHFTRLFSKCKRKH
ncbi:hypothetical protein [Halobacteriovorax sp. YZS-1-1]|uniref:hypothetical protein n=1 Tax=unclassified Halobacteriovorax TaxID=2639665 RepID=UPI003999D9AD